MLIINPMIAIMKASMIRSENGPALGRVTPKLYVQMEKSYRIAGNFHMVQIFAVFADRSATAKIRTTNFSIANYGLLVGVVSPER